MSHSRHTRAFLWWWHQLYRTSSGQNEINQLIKWFFFRDVEQPIADASRDFSQPQAASASPSDVRYPGTSSWQSLFACTPGIVSTHRLVLSLMDRQDQSLHAKESKFSERQQTDTPRRAGYFGEQQFLWSPTMSQRAPLPTTSSHSSAQTAHFRTP